MAVDLANAHGLAGTAGVIAAGGHAGRSRYPSDPVGWRLGDLDRSEHPDRHHDQRLMLIIAPAGEAEAATYTCGVCGFVINEVEECPRCRLASAGAGDEGRGGETANILDQVRELLDAADGDVPANPSD
jgi:hypothetical protein